MSQFKVSYDDRHFIRVEMDGFLPHDLYKSGWTQVLELFEKHPACHRVFISVKDGKIISNENQKWFAENYIPAVREILNKRHQTLKQARILDGDYFNQVSAKNIFKTLQDAHLPLVFEEFDREDRAIAWLIA